MNKKKNKRGSKVRKQVLVTVIAVLFGILCAGQALAQDAQFYAYGAGNNSPTVYDSNGTTALPTGSLLQIIYAAGTTPNPPDATTGAPTGGDALVDATARTVNGTFGDGTFDHSLTNLTNSVRVYVRAWNSPTINVTTSRYGDSDVFTLGAPPSPPDSFEMLADIVTATQPGGAAVSDTTLPIIKDVKFNGNIIQDQDVISPHAIITATVTDEAGGSGVDANSITVTINQTIYSRSTTPVATYEASTATMTLNFTPATIADGKFAVTINANDMAGNAAIPYIMNVVVQAGEAVIDGKVFNFPNPFNPLKPENTTIAYNLTNDANIAIYVFDITAKLVWEAQYDSGTNGGKLGYNEVEWDGHSGFNDLPGSGVYLVRVLNRDTRRVIGKGKIVIALR